MRLRANHPCVPVRRCRLDLFTAPGGLRTLTIYYHHGSDPAEWVAFSGTEEFGPGYTVRDAFAERHLPPAEIDQADAIDAEIRYTVRQGVGEPVTDLPPYVREAALDYGWLPDGARRRD